MVIRLGLFFVMICALVGIAVFGVSAFDKSKQHEAAAGPPTEQVLVAADLIHAGSLLQPSDIAAAATPVATAPPGAITDTPQARAALLGAMVRSQIGQGSPIFNAAVIHPGDHGFLAAVLAPGMRAVTIGVDNVSGAAGLIWPGDHVDVLLTQTLDDSSVPLGQRIAAELVLQDVRVIATGQQLVQGATGTTDKTAPPPATTVTLEVTADQAERCAVAGHLGPLSLVVQSAQPGAADADTAPAAPVWAGEVSPALANAHPAQPVISTVHVFQGGSGGQDFNF